MQTLEILLIIVGGIIGIGSIISSVVIFYKMKKSKDGVWRL